MLGASRLGIAVLVLACGSTPSRRDAGIDASIDAGFDPTICSPPEIDPGIGTVEATLGLAPGPGVEIDAFCDGWVEIVSEMNARCACPPDFTYDPRPHCEAMLSPRLRDLIATGDARWDPDAAALALAVARDLLSDCAAWSFPLERLLALSGAIDAPLVPGACTGDTDPFVCGPGSYCEPAGDLSYACTAAPPAPCAAFGLCGHEVTCAGATCDPGLPGGATWEDTGRRCAHGAYFSRCRCAPAGPGGRCIAYDSSTCRPSLICTPDGVCTQGAAIGEPCSESGCAEGSCTWLGCVANACHQY